VSEPGAITLRVHSISTEVSSTKKGTTDTPPAVVTQVTLVPHGGESGFEVLGGQKLLLHFHDCQHPLLGRLRIDQVFELRPAPAPAHPPSPGRSYP
jgi:hypothetical protein